jgi:2-polyprenyl-3-methyl-5-hydroxy-6-metoxy-1,4-benzoquinol methylase
MAELTNLRADTVGSGRKPADYYEHPRVDFLAWVAPTGSRALDLGCGAGAFGPTLRDQGFTYVVGVEIEPQAAARARAIYDVVLDMPIEEALPRVEGSFDLIICADVLEHLSDPWSVVSELRRMAHAGTALAVSIPNIRYWRALLRLAFGRGFAYEESGIFDATHLRFFTSADALRMLRESGWTPQRVGAPPPGRLRVLRQLVRDVTRHWTSQWTAEQTWVVCRLSPDSIPEVRAAGS